MKMNLSAGWTYDWHARYLIEQDGAQTEHEDLTTLRAFTGDEILLFLKLTGFVTREVINEAKTMTFIAEKK